MYLAISYANCYFFKKLLSFILKSAIVKLVFYSIYIMAARKTEVSFMPYQRFCLEGAEPAQTGDLPRIEAEILYITQSYYDHDWPSVLHTHHFTELFYVLDGEGMFLVEDKKIPVRADDLVIINPNVTHTEQCDTKQRFEYIVLGVSGLQFSNATGLHHNYSVHNFHSNKKEVIFILQSILKEAQKKEENFLDVCQNLLDILLIYLMRKNESAMIADDSKKASRECRFIEQYIDEHFSEDISLETLSSLTYMNKYYLVHAFKNYKGVSPINYLIDKRIQEAKTLLETTNFSIAKIAQHVGFSSQSYFSQIFRKVTGETPIKYKKNFEQNNEK